MITIVFKPYPNSRYTNLKYLENCTCLPRLEAFAYTFVYTPYNIAIGLFKSKI